MDCPLCAADTRFTTRNVYAVHSPPSSPAQQVCDASGKTRAEVIALLRTFRNWDDPEGVVTTLDVIDQGDSISLDSAILLAGSGGERIAAVPVRIRPEDTRRLITQLTQIADDRGL